MILKKDYLSNIGIFLMLIPIFQPKIFTQFPITTLIYILLNVSLLIYLLYNFYKKDIKISKPCIIWVIYRVWLFLSSLLTNTLSGILQWGYLSIMVFDLFLIFDLCKKEKQKQLLNGIYMLSTILLLINLITLIVFPRGIIKSTFYDVTDNDYYFLGIKTQFTTMIFPGLSAIFLLYKNDKRKYKMHLILFTVVSVLNVFYKNISTAIVGLIILIVLLLIQRMFKVKLNSKLCILFVIIFQILIVFFNIQVLFNSFFTDILHKDATLSARTYIWENAKELLKNENLPNLLFGNGVAEHNEVVYYSGDYWQPHNQLLVWLYNSGIFGTLFILYFFYLLMMRKSNSNELYTTSLIICFTVMLLTVTEVYFDVAVCYIPFLIIYYMTDFICNKEKNSYRRENEYFINGK